MSPSSISLFELQEFIRRVLALNLPEALWIRAEIGQLKTSRGHVYIDLVEKEAEGEEWTAQAPAVIWSTALRQLRKRIGDELEALLSQGMEVLVKATIEYHERFGLKLIIQDIDPTYTIGKLAQAHALKLQQIRAEGLIGKNAAQRLPAVIQRIAVISSPQAAGWQDFNMQLQENPYGYAFSVTLFPAAMQGALLEPEIQAQLEALAQRPHAFDAVAILRGGGARLDLAGFDSLLLCRSIAHFPLPVFTGIGHDIDETLLDLVAYTSLKTPTALAAYFVQHNLAFETQLLGMAASIKEQAQSLHTRHIQVIDRIQQIAATMPRQRVLREKHQLELMAGPIPAFARHRLAKAAQALELATHTCRLLSIDATLQRGYALISKNGHPLPHSHDAHPGDTIDIQLADGALKATIL